MREDRKSLSSLDIKAYLGRLRQNPKYTDEAIKLVEDDLRFGLTIEETEEYSGGRYDYRQMRVYSRCLRDGLGKEERKALLKEEYGSERMEVAVEFYEKGVPLNTITEALSSAENTAYAMKHLFGQVLHDMKAAQAAGGQEGPYAKELMEQIRQVADKISCQENRYDALNERLKKIGEDTREKNSLRLEVTEKTGMIERQQDELNREKTENIRLHRELDRLKAEREALEEQMKKAGGKRTDGAEGKEEGEQEKTEKPDGGGRAAGAPAGSGVSGAGYHAAILDRDGRTLCVVPVERQKRKDRGRVMAAMASRLFRGKKTDIIRMLAERDLTPEQLLQVRSAMEKGLSEEQILILANGRIPAGQMEELIHIAVYENKMKEGQ